jgi:Stress responsive A/B Barrel Domain
MIHHVVLFRFNEGVTDAQVRAAGAELEALAGRIPEIRRIAFGPNQAPGAGEWPWALLVLLDDMAAVQRYAEHPAHVDVVQRVLAPIRAGRLAVDLEVPA